MILKHHPGWQGCLLLLFTLGWACVSALAEAGTPAQGEAQVSERGAVATVNALATQAGMAVLAKGGNAVDAAVAAVLALGVVDGHNSGVGGGAFVLIRTSDGKLIALDGRETAPAKATRDMFIRNGVADTQLSQVGALASGVPGSVMAYERAIALAGAKSFSEVIQPSIALAEKGFPLDRLYATRLANSADRLAQFEESRKVLLQPDGQPWPAGHILIQQDLATTLKGIARDGSNFFYQGSFAQALDSWMEGHGGLLSKDDFAQYQVIERTPLLSDYRGFEIVGFPPPSSGGMHVAQILGMVQGHNLGELGEAERYHLLGEAMKLAFADRAYWLGDPDFTKVPAGLIDPAYLSRQAARLDPAHVITVETHGDPTQLRSTSDAEKDAEDLFRKHTTHIATADYAGNWVAITTTVNTDFGSKVIIPGTGVIMNNQMDDFSTQPGVPNAYGLVGAEANSIQPGKRPLSSMSPTLVLKDGKPLMTLGAAGGPTIITQVVQTLINYLDLQLPLEQALSKSRIHQQWRPDVLFIEANLPADTRKALQQKGHILKEMGPYGSTQAIAMGQDGKLIAVSEPRLKARNEAP